MLIKRSRQDPCSNQGRSATDWVKGSLNQERVVNSHNKMSSSILNFTDSSWLKFKHASKDYKIKTSVWKYKFKFGNLRGRHKRINLLLRCYLLKRRRVGEGGRFGDCGGGGERKAVVQVVAWSAVRAIGGARPRAEPSWGKHDFDLNILNLSTLIYSLLYLFQKLFTVINILQKMWDTCQYSYIKYFCKENKVCQLIDGKEFLV